MEVKGSIFITTGLPIIIGLIMFGLGLTLKTEDMWRVLKMPKANLIGLFIKLVLLPAIAYALAVVFALPTNFAIGMLMVAAAPSSAMANVFSRLSGADLALSLCITAIDNFLTAITLPLYVALGFYLFAGESQQIGMQWEETLKIFALILIPVSAGIIFSQKWPTVGAKIEKALRGVSVLVLAVLVVGVVSANRGILIEYAAQLAGVVWLFNLICFLTGYYIPRMAGLNQTQSRSLMFAMGIQGTALIVTIAISILNNAAYAMPSAFFSLSMYVMSFAIIGIMRKMA